MNVKWNCCSQQFRIVSNCKQNNRTLPNCSIDQSAYKWQAALFGSTINSEHWHRSWTSAPAIGYMAVKPNSRLTCLDYGNDRLLCFITESSSDQVWQIQLQINGIAHSEWVGVGDLPHKAHNFNYFTSMICHRQTLIKVWEGQHSVMPGSTVHEGLDRWRSCNWRTGDSTNRTCQVSVW